ncbi:FtsX-like permease family protein [Actinomadura citrea]|uniref:Putative ABC transport system permease protein n=1 Tax=Actinomadura citrea TaxID=46158 RepID=A0A7Y9G6I7_9ACTN|nr:FtsX-like permease family protein [Actinomadura citrea]NYE10858.1 putative ABC transport system permease protein [Actinomadura citrea]GGT73471.1 transporter [Actinomadura citrea]
MLTLALNSLRRRSGGFAASFLAMFCGAMILMAFGSLLDTAGAKGVDPASESTLNVLGLVVGGWGLLLVTFAVTSTLTLSVRQRAAEMALLKNIGATPGQITRMITGEALILAVAAVSLAIVPAAYTGGWLLDRLTANGQIATSITHHFGGFAIHIGYGVTLVAATAAALTAARRTARMSATASLLDAAAGDARMSRKRVAAAAVFLFLGTDLAVITATAMRGKDDFEPMATAGPAAIWFSIGLALLAPALLRRVAAWLEGPLQRGGAAGQLAALNLAQRTGPMSTAVMPIILFTGIATGTLYMQATDNAVNAASGITETADYRNAETTNMIVIGMILLFAAIMVVNSLVATTVDRRREFGQQRLIGATPRQVLQMVAGEGTVLAATGVLFGTLASLVTIIPFSIARSGSPVPHGNILLYLAVAAIAAALALATSLAAAHRTLRTPAIDAATT